MSSVFDCPLNQLLNPQPSCEAGGAARQCASLLCPTVHCLLLLALVLSGCESNDHVRGAVDKRFECRWATSPIEIDGQADEAAWQQAEPINNFYIPWFGKQGRPVEAATRARLLWGGGGNTFISLPPSTAEIFLPISPNTTRKSGSMMSSKCLLSQQATSLAITSFRSMLQIPNSICLSQGGTKRSLSNTFLPGHFSSTWQLSTMVRLMFTRTVTKGDRLKAKFPGPILFARVSGQFRAKSCVLPCVGTTIR